MGTAPGGLRATLIEMVETGIAEQASHRPTRAYGLTSSYLEAMAAEAAEAGGPAEVIPLSAGARQTSIHAASSLLMVPAMRPAPITLQTQERFDVRVPVRLTMSAARREREWLGVGVPRLLLPGYHGPLRVEITNWGVREASLRRGEVIGRLTAESVGPDHPAFALRQSDSDGGFGGPGLLGPDGAPLRPEQEQYQVLSASFQRVSAAALARLAADPALLMEMHWRDFEYLIADLFRREGFEVELTAPSGDGGADLYAVRRTGLGALLYVVECKRHRADRPVGPDLVRQLVGVVERERANRGVLVTTSYFTAGAREEGRSFGFRLALQDYERVRAWLLGSPIE